MPVICAAVEVDFDGKPSYYSDAHVTITEAMANISAPSVSPSKAENTDTATSVGHPSKIAFEITADGEKIIEPITRMDGKSSYEFMKYFEDYVYKIVKVNISSDWQCIAGWDEVMEVRICGRNDAITAPAPIITLCIA